MECVGFVLIASFFREDKDLGEASEEFGIECSSLILWRRGALSKKLSWLVVTRPSGIRRRQNVVRFDRFFQGRCVMTPVRLNSRNDGKSPSENESLRMGVGGTEVTDI